MEQTFVAQHLPKIENAIYIAFLSNHKKITQFVNVNDWET
jgi:hypothetical protein